MKKLFFIVALLLIASASFAGNLDGLVMHGVRNDITAIHGIYAADSGFFGNAMLFNGAEEKQCETTQTVEATHFKKPKPKPIPEPEPPVVQPEPSPAPQPPTLKVVESVKCSSVNSLDYLVGGGYRWGFAHAWLYAGGGWIGNDTRSVWQWGVISPFDKNWTIGAWMIFDGGTDRTFAGIGYRW